MLHEQPFQLHGETSDNKRNEKPALVLIHLGSVFNPDYALEMRKRFRNCKSDFYKSDNIF